MFSVNARSKRPIQTPIVGIKIRTHGYLPNSLFPILVFYLLNYVVLDKIKN